MTRSLIIVTFFLLPLGLFGQNRLIDSVKYELKKINSDSGRANAYNELCFLYRYVNIDTAIFYGDAGYDLSKKINYLRGQCRALDVLGLAYRESGNLTKALEFLYKSLQIANENNFIGERGLCLRRIGLIHADLSNWVLARDYHYQAIKDYKVVNDKKSIAIAYSNICRFFDEDQKYDSARLYIQESAVLMHHAPDLYPDFYYTLAKLEQHTGNREASMTAAVNGKKWAVYYSDFRNLCNMYGQISRLFAEMGMVDSTVKNAELAIYYGKKINFRLGLLRVYEFLSGYYDKKDPVKALNFLKEYNAVRESMYGTGNMRAMQNLVVAEVQRQQEIIEVEKAYQNKIKIYLLLGGLFVLLIIAALFFRNSINQKKSRTLLRQQNDELEKSLHQLRTTQTQLIQSEKMASLGELTAGIAHEIQNPLNFVNNFSEVNAELIEEAQNEINNGNQTSLTELLSDIKANSEKITFHGKRADAIVKSMLQHSRQSSGQKELTDINALCDEYLRLAYHGLRAKEKSFTAQFETDFDASLPQVNVVSQDIGRVILNLINNAFYAVNERHKKEGKDGYIPQVKVTTRRTGDQVEITVTDNGGGIPENIREKIFQPFFTTKPTGEGTGLGLSMSYDIITKGHGGTLQVIPEKNAGSTFLISIPF